MRAIAHSLCSQHRFLLRLPSWPPRAPIFAYYPQMSAFSDFSPLPPCLLLLSPRHILFPRARQVLLTNCAEVKNPIFNLRVQASCDLSLIPHTILFLQVLLANYVEVNNDERDSTMVSEELREEFEEYWRQHAENPLKG